MTYCLINLSKLIHKFGLKCLFKVFGSSIEFFNTFNLDELKLKLILFCRKLSFCVNYVLS